LGGLGPYFTRKSQATKLPQKTYSPFDPFCHLKRDKYTHRLPKGEKWSTGRKWEEYDFT